MLVFWAPVTAVAEQTRVLILNSYHQGFSWTDRVMSGVRSVLDKEQDLELSITYMDTKRRADKKYFLQFRDILQHKYEYSKFDIIISSDDNALNFLLEFSDELFPGVPIVFSGINAYHPSRIEGKKNFTGVYETYDIAATIEMMLDIHPSTTQIVTILDGTVSGKAFEGLIKSVENHFVNRVKIDYLSGVDLESVRQRLQVLPTNTLVLWAIYLLTPSGVSLSSEESIRFITGHSNRPVYCLWDVVGQGVIGGKITPPEYQGVQSAKLALQILKGELASNLPVKGSPMVHKFDFSQMKKFGISQDQLPSDSVIINKPDNIYDRLKTLIRATFGLLLLLLCIIVLLIGYIRKRRLVNMAKAEAAVRSKYMAQMNEANKHLEDAIKARSLFLASMSHEIRTPMNGVLGMIELIEDTPLSKEQRNFLDVAYRSGQTLLVLLNDILDLSKIEAGKMEFESLDFSNDQLISDIKQLFDIQLLDNNLFLDFERTHNAPNWVKGDRTRIWQILINLVSNAIKFTREGGISIKVHTTSSGNVLYSITDTGMGISETAQARIFDSFTQADSSTTRKFGGTGLGLTISKRLAECMGGDLKLTSTPNVGSTFTLELPLPSGTPLPQSSEARLDDNEFINSSRSIHVLLAEDSEVNQMVATGMFKKMGISVDIANDGLEAVQRSKEQHYDLIFMDIHMPNVDGYSATKRIFSDCEKNAETPIIAMTANAMEGDRQTCLNAGMKDYVTKPIQYSRLYKVAAKWINRTTAPVS